VSVSRRIFIKSGAIAVVGFGSLPGFLVRASGAARGRRKTLVVLFQRGAADGLNIVVPHGDESYYRLRPSIAIPRPRRRESETLLDIDGFFGFHPSLKPLKDLYDSEMLAVIHAAGSPDATRSHLLAIPELSKFGIKGRYGELARQGLEALYASSEDPLLSPTARETFEAVDFLEQVDPASHRPANGAVYPPGAFGKSLLQVAQLIKSDVGLEVAFSEIGGWDHHVNEGGVRGPLANLLRQFSAGIGAFVRDLGDRMDDVVVVTLSEFGRTARENGNRGTDHGHATAMFVIGGSVRGGKIYGDWPGLEPEQLYQGRDLALTTDFRDVVGRLLVGHLGAGDLEQVFPGHRFRTDRFVELV
jgi:uncharacterized protein (DUF1501 family)